MQEPGQEPFRSEFLVAGFFCEPLRTQGAPQGMPPERLHVCRHGLVLGTVLLALGSDGDDMHDLSGAQAHDHIAYGGDLYSSPMTPAPPWRVFMLPPSRG